MYPPHSQVSKQSQKIDVSSITKTLRKWFSFSSTLMFGSVQALEIDSRTVQVLILYRMLLSTTYRALQEERNVIQMGFYGLDVYN